MKYQLYKNVTMENDIIRKGYFSKEIKDVSSALNNLVAALEGADISDEKAEEIKRPEIEYANCQLKRRLSKDYREYYLNKLNQLKQAQLIKFDYMHALGQVSFAEIVLENIKRKLQKQMNY